MDKHLITLFFQGAGFRLQDLSISTSRLRRSLFPVLRDVLVDVDVVRDDGDDM